VVKGLIFDFDGLLVETEEPSFQVWQRVYREYGHELPLDRWLTLIGTATATFNPHAHLEERVGHPIDRESLRAQREAYYRELTAMQSLLPGVEDYIREGRRRRMKLAIASSSRRQWIVEHLDRLGIPPDQWDAIVTREDVEQTKPDPALYLEALRRIDVGAAEAIAFEDSRNGVLAAKAAGLFCVAVPNPMTANMDLTIADLRVDSLADLPLTELLEQIEAAA
jgi:HAD superfamily hydrolase (TIGR01509 family)